MDNTNWRAGRAGGPCLQMKNVNFWRAAHCTEDSPPARLFPQPSLMCSPPTSPSCSAVCRPTLLCISSTRGKFMFFIRQHGPPARPPGPPALPAGPPALRLVLSLIHVPKQWFLTAGHAIPGAHEPLRAPQHGKSAQ